MTGTPSRLDRRLGLSDAVVIGLGSMLGTGVFVVFAPAAAEAGRWLLAGLLLAAVVAYANASSTAQLAAVHPASGGAYVYGRERLGPGWGALAGYAFVLGKTASAAAAALAVGAYAWPDQQRAVAAVAVIAVTAVNYFGIGKTVAVTRVLVAVLLVVLGLVVAVALTAPGAGTGSGGTAGSGAADAGPAGIPAAAALLFFAFAGYARIATLGEEVRDPARTIPRAIPIALGVTLLVYVAVAAAVLHALGVSTLAGSTTPLADAVRAAGADALVPVVRAAAAVAALAVLLSLIAGVGRTVFAMSAAGDLPPGLDAVHRRHRVPHRAELLAGGVALAVVLTGGLVGAVSFSAFTVLLYYAVANTSALRLRPEERRAPRWLAAAGLLGCLGLAASLPLSTVVSGVAVLAGLAGLRMLLRR